MNTTVGLKMVYVFTIWLYRWS